MWPRVKKCPLCEEHAGQLADLLEHMDTEHGSWHDQEDVCLVCGENMSKFSWKKEAEHVEKYHTYKDLCKAAVLAELGKV